MNDQEINFKNKFKGILLDLEGVLYEENGSLRQFGLGTRKKTVIPIWFLTLMLAIFCYLFVMYYLAIPKFRY